MLLWNNLSSDIVFFSAALCHKRWHAHVYKAHLNIVINNFFVDFKKVLSEFICLHSTISKRDFNYIYSMHALGGIFIFFGITNTKLREYSHMQDLIIYNST